MVRKSVTPQSLPACMHACIGKFVQDDGCRGDMTCRCRQKTLTTNLVAACAGRIPECPRDTFPSFFAAFDGMCAAFVAVSPSVALPPLQPMIRPTSNLPGPAPSAAATMPKAYVPPPPVSQPPASSSLNSPTVITINLSTVSAPPGAGTATVHVTLSDVKLPAGAAPPSSPISVIGVIPAIPGVPAPSDIAEAKPPPPSPSSSKPSPSSALKPAFTIVPMSI